MTTAHLSRDPVRHQVQIVLIGTVRTCDTCSPLKSSALNCQFVNTTKK